MTKSKKLISMLLAFVMLVTSCSMSFFAFADAAAVAEAEAAVVTAISNMSANTVKADDTTMIGKVNALTNEEVLQMKPLYYAYVLHVATTKMIRNDGKTPNATLRANKLKALGNGDATVTAAYRAYVKVPDEYIQVIGDINAANAQCTDGSYATYKPRLITDTDTTNLNFITNTNASALYDTFWAKYNSYTKNQAILADFFLVNSSNGVTNAFTSTIGANIQKNKAEPADALIFYQGDRMFKRFAAIYYAKNANTVNGTSLKAKYSSGGTWTDTETVDGAAEYYGTLKAYFANADTHSKNFYVNYFAFINSKYGEIVDNGAVAKIIDAGLALAANEGNEDAVDFETVKEAYEAYESLNDATKFALETVSDYCTEALFNVEFTNIQMKSGIDFANDSGSIDFLNQNYSIAHNTAYTGLTFIQLKQKVADRYTAYLPIHNYKVLVNTTIAKPEITADDVTAVWNAFNALDDSYQTAIRESGELWDNTTKIMTSQFVDYVKAVDLDNVTAENITQSTSRYEGLLDEFKALFTTDDNYKPIYEKYLQILISDFRYYVEGVDINNVTAENRTVAAEKYNALTDELKAVVQADETLYNKYLAILASEFKEYINSIDLSTVDEAKRQEAKEKYQNLSDAAKEVAYSDAEVWDKYYQIQTPDVDGNKHSEEAAKTADKATLPTESEAIKDLGLAKSVDNVEDFVADDLLPLLTDKVKIDNKNDAVNSALKQYYTNETVGKVYGIYAKLSHNQTEINGVKAGTLVQTQLIPKESLVARLYEDDFANAKGKIYNVIATNAIPSDSEGNPVKVEIGTADDGTAIYEDANIYDGIAAIDFASGDFGFTDGDKEGFTKALLAALRPITGVCAPGSPLGIEFFNHVDKNTGAYTMGIYECAVTVLEALGVTGLPTNDEYKLNYYTVFQTEYARAEGSVEEKQLKAASIAGDEYLRPIIDAVFRFIDSDLKTMPDVLALIPRLGDIIRSEMPKKVYLDFKADLGMLSGLLSTINYQGVDIPIELVLDPYILPSALLALVNEKLEGIGVTLAMPNWNELNKYTTFKVNPSSQQNKDYVAVRYIDGDVMLTELVYYAYDNLIANDENCAAVKEKIGGLPLVGKNLEPLIDNAKKAGKLNTYAAILDYFYEKEGEGSKDATADAGKSVGEALAGINAKLNFAPIDCSKAVIKVSKRKYSYNGKIQKPSVKVTLNGETLTKGIAYKVSYSNSSSKKIGAYTVKVTFIGGYEGPEKTFKYTIGPRNAKKIALKAKSGAVKITWQKSTTKACKGYVIQYSTSSSFKNAKIVKVAGRSKTAKTITGLNSGKKYYVRIKAYAVKSGKKYYSCYSTKKAVTVK